MLPNLKSLAVFAKVAEMGSFSAAAKALKISAPVVSQHISQLESSVDTALVYRSTRSLKLTNAGQRLAEYARRMLDAAEEGLEELHNTIESPRGKLSVAMPSFMTSPKFTRVLSEFCDLYPDVILEVSYTVDSHNLNESGYDLAIQVGDLQDSNFMARKLLEGHACLFASPDLLARMGPIETPEDMFTLNYPFISEIDWSHVELIRLDGSQTYSNVRVNTVFLTDNGEAKKQMALLGRGIAWLPEMYVEHEVESGQLIRVLPDWHSENVGVYAVWPKNAGSRSLTRLFLDFLDKTIVRKLQAEQKTQDVPNIAPLLVG